MGLYAFRTVLHDNERVLYSYRVPSNPVASSSTHVYVHRVVHRKTCRIDKYVGVGDISTIQSSTVR
jgi:hypothetical protein